MNADKINGIGSIFRFITPVLIIVIGSMIVMHLNNLTESVKLLDGHFTNHLSYHTLLEKEYEHRITSLEIITR